MNLKLFTANTFLPGQEIKELPQSLVICWAGQEMTADTLSLNYKIFEAEDTLFALSLSSIW